MNAYHQDHLSILHEPNTGFKCVYLTENGCRWKVKPTNKCWPPFRPQSASSAWICLNSLVLIRPI